MATPTPTGQTGYHQNDIRYFGSDEQILSRVAAMRRSRNLPPDPASDRIWLRRIKSGGIMVFGEARTAIENKARQMAERASSGGGSSGGSSDPEGDSSPPPNPEGFDTAFSIIKDFLKTYDLDYDEKTVREWAGLLSDDPDNMVIVEEQIRQSPEFLARFPGLQQRVNNGFNQITVAEYLELEDTYKTLLRSSGLPKSFYDEASDLASFISNDVSPQELEYRVQRGYLAARQAPTEVKQALSDFYGIGNSEGALAAYYLDPEKALPAIEREFAAATVAGTGSQFGFSATQDFAERLVSLGIVSREQAAAGFGQANAVRPLGVETITERTDITDQNLVESGFDLDPDMQRRLLTRVQRRGSDMAGSGSGGGVAGSGGTTLGGARR